MGTNNAENCATSCHAPGVVSHAESFRSRVMTNSATEHKCFAYSLNQVRAKAPDLNPAAFVSAALLLKKEGKLRS